mmetsp:Transcript_39891/g.114930  ORF Transcript_39891/g.114930 Transcript_39891/m.114930 type:complete len:93 (+) Transcript_39891:249-527(+)
MGGRSFGATEVAGGFLQFTAGFAFAERSAQTILQPARESPRSPGKCWISPEERIDTAPGPPSSIARVGARSWCCRIVPALRQGTRTTTAACT